MNEMVDNSGKSWRTRHKMFNCAGEVALWQYVVKFSSKILVSERDTNKNGWKLTNFDVT